MSKREYDSDYIVIGSGFGGSVSAMRLSEKGYSVNVLEAGKRFRPQDFPKTNWNFRRYLWLPLLRCFGIFKITILKHVFIFSGSGVGGGSLVYANTLLIPPEKVWDDPQWSSLQDWKKIMPDFYQLARKMLGVTRNPYFGQSDKMLRETAQEFDSEIVKTFVPTDVAIYFGKPGVTVKDPFFGGAGPDRTGCTLCGGCMMGCSHGAKNTLDKNYLYFAEKNGAKIVPETQVLSVTPIDAENFPHGEKGYLVKTVSSTAWFKKEKVYRTKGVVFSGGVLGSVKLLLDCKEKKHLPLLSDALGQTVRTNSESIIGVRFPRNLPGSSGKTNMPDGVAIGSSMHIDDNTHIEPVRYPHGCGGLSALCAPMSSEVGFFKYVKNYLRAVIPWRWSTESLILLVMQPLDNQLSLRLRSSPFAFMGRQHKKIDSVLPEGQSLPPLNIPRANQFAKTMAKKFKGMALTGLSEVLLKIPTTAHILGGCPMGESVKTGVIDGQNRVYNYQNMYVCDGSMVSANLGVNPSLTITALTEQAMRHIEPKNSSINAKIA